MIGLSDQEFHQFSQFIYQQAGIVIKDEKKSMVLGRLQQLLSDRRLNGFSALLQALTGDRSGVLMTELLNRITTNHTYFMRESDHFEFFSSEVLPYLEATVRSRDLGIWSAGCSSGEEPYTLAMITRDYFGNQFPQWDAEILATDISMKVLGMAERGIYTMEKVAPLPAHWKLNYFEKLQAAEMRVKEELRRQIVFRPFNLMQEHFPFRRRFHVIFCRNVMIYFDQETKVKLVGKFHEFLEPGGYLFIGHSESLQRNETELQYVMPSVYRKV